MWNYAQWDAQCNRKCVPYLYKIIETHMEVWENRKCYGSINWQVGISKAFSSSPKFPQVFIQLDRNTENMFSVSFRRLCDEKTNHQNVNSLFSCYHYINNLMILHQSVNVFSLDHFVIYDIYNRASGRVPGCRTAQFSQSCTITKKHGRSERKSNKKLPWKQYVPLSFCDSFKSFCLQIIFNNFFCSPIWFMDRFKSLFLSCSLVEKYKRVHKISFNEVKIFLQQ